MDRDERRACSQNGRPRRKAEAPERERRGGSHVDRTLDLRGTAYRGPRDHRGTVVGPGRVDSARAERSDHLRTGTTRGAV